MTFQRHKYIIDFFDVSVLIPLDAGDGEVLKKNLATNHRYWMQNGIEVVLISGDAEHVMDLPNEFPFINWKIILAKDEWVKTTTAKLNTGLLYACHRYVLVMGPEITLKTDSVYELRYAVYHYPQSFATMARYDDGMEYTLFMAERSALQAIGGFSEFGDDRLNKVNIHRRLELAGQYKIALEAPSSSLASLTFPTDLPSPLLHADVLFPRHPNARFPGTQFSDDRLPGASISDDAPESVIGFDWTRDKSPRTVNLVLEKFEKVTLKSQKIFQPHYGIICLIQVRNEARHIPGVLSHLDNLCDGIILLDDGSSDGSYEEASSEKLLVKVQKSNKGFFDDLGNRNMLLDLAYLFKAEWFFFIDADERFDFRYATLRQAAQMKDTDTVAFRLVHLWNSESQYRKDFPEGNKGVVSRNRMFRNKGYMQVAAEREIHFCTTPFKHNRFRSPILLLHYGLIDEATRVKKFTAYLSQDAGGKKQGYSYDYLLDKQIEWSNVDDLILPSPPQSAC